MNNKPELTIEILLESAKEFCKIESNFKNSDLFGITDGKAVGTYIEHKFQKYILDKYECFIGSSAKGIDFPSDTINTDIKVTSIKQPQSSCPFKDARQKIYGLGYNLLVFVYDKNDNQNLKVAELNFVSCNFVSKERTADFQTTSSLRILIENNANIDDISAFLIDRNLPLDESFLRALAEEILGNPPKLGYLTISNALQWRLQYSRLVNLKENVDGIIKIVDRING